MSLELLLGGLGAFAAGALVELAWRAGLAGIRGRPGLAAAWSGLSGGGLVSAAGFAAVGGPPRTANLGDLFGLGPTLVRLDGLAGLFLALVGALTLVVSATLLGARGAPAEDLGPSAGLAYLVLLASATVVLVADDVFTLLFAWEALTLAFYVLVGGGASVGPHRGGEHGRPRGAAALLAFGTGKLSGAALITGLLLAAGAAGGDSLGALARVGPGGVRDAAFALAVVGFGAKVGIVPFQVWMPRAYPFAPGLLRAALAGLAVNVGFYGLMRTLALFGRPPVGLAVAVLAAGAVTALGGVVFAAVEADLLVLVSLSSVEQGGLVVVGFGVALAGASVSEPMLVAAGLLAATLQLLAHAVAKTALFSSAALFVPDRGTTSLDELRGVGRTHPYAATAFSLASLTLAGLPPTIGFVSEWFLFESLMQEFRVRPLELRLAMVGAGALVALSAGLAALAFARILGLSLLGRPPSACAPAPRGEEGRVPGRVALAVLAASPLGLAAFAPLVVRFLAAGLSGVAGASSLASALRSPLVLEPVYPGFSILSPSLLVVALPVGALAVGAGALLASRGRLAKVRRVEAWRSATPGVAGTDRYTSFGYANPARHVLANLLGARREVVPVEDVTESGWTDRAHLEARSSVVEPVEAYLYRPARAALLALARLARRLQSGRLEAYVAYMLAALIVVLVVAALA
jgi:hydrogenase-4 component B